MENRWKRNISVEWFICYVFRIWPDQNKLAVYWFNVLLCWYRTRRVSVIMFAWIHQITVRRIKESISLDSRIHTRIFGFYTLIGVHWIRSLFDIYIYIFGYCNGNVQINCHVICSQVFRNKKRILGVLKKFFLQFFLSVFIVFSLVREFFSYLFTALIRCVVWSQTWQNKTKQLHSISCGGRIAYFTMVRFAFAFCCVFSF